MNRTNRYSKALSRLIATAAVAAGLILIGGCSDGDNGETPTSRAETTVSLDAKKARQADGRKASSRGEKAGTGRNGRGSNGSASRTPDTGSAGTGNDGNPDRVEMTADEKAAQGNAELFYDILGQDRGDRDTADFDSARFCDLMSRQARQQTIDYARGSSGIDQEWTCENSVEQLVIRSKRTGGFKQTRKAEIVGVNAEGDRATATVRFGKGPLTSIPLVKEDGEWKLGARVSPPGG